MQLQLTWIVAALAATVAALPTSTDDAANALPAELDTRQACRLDSFRSQLHTDQIRPVCKWYVCGANGVWREVRNCGLDSRCDANPTTCRDRFGNPF